MKKTILALFMSCMFAGIYSQSTSWELLTPTPFPNTAYDLQAISNSTVLAVGEQGMLFTGSHYADSADFQFVSGSAQLQNFKATGVHFTDSLNGFVLDNYAKRVAYTSDGGVSWSYLTGGYSVFPEVLGEMHFVNSSYGWICAANGKLYKTSDGGLNWTEQPSQTTEDLSNLHMTDTSTGYAVGRNGKLVKTIDSGTNWDTVTTGTNQDLNDCFFVTPDTGWIAGRKVLMKTTDGGMTWINQYQQTPSGWDVYWEEIEFANKDTGYAVGKSTLEVTIGYTTDGGSNWTLMETDTVLDITELAVSPNGNAWFAFRNVMMRMLDLSGTLEVLTNSDIAFTQNLTGVEPLDSSTVYAFGHWYNWKSTDAGATWQKENLPVSSAAAEILFHDPNTGYLFSSTGDVYQTTDGGATWNMQGSHGISSLLGVQLQDQSTMYGWGFGQLEKSSDGGQTWTAISLPSTNQVINVHFFNDNEGYAVTRNDVFYTSDGGANWLTRPMAPNPYIDDAQFLSHEIGFLSRDSVYITRDSAKTWTPLFYNNWKINYVHFMDDSTGWIYGENFIMSTYDGGATFNLDYSGLQSFIRDMEFAGTTTGYAVGKNSMILKAYAQNLDIDTLFQGGGGSASTVITSLKEDRFELSVYPNPVKHRLYISHTSEKPVLITILNAGGKRVKPYIMCRDNSSINISDLAPGYYFLRVDGEEVRIAKPVIIE